MAIGIANIEAFLKGQFKKGAVQDLTLKQGPLLGLINKQQDLGGEYLKIPVIYGGIPSGSGDFAAAQAMAGTGLQGVAFKIESDNVPEDFSIFQVTGKMLAMGKRDAHAFFNNLDKIVKAAYAKQSQRLAFHLYGSYHGHVGSLASTVTVGSTNAVLTNRGEGRAWDVGMRFQLLNPATYALRTGTGDGYCTIAGITRTATACTLVTSADIDVGITDAVASDLILPYGDRNAVLHGLADILDNAAAPATLHGVTRTVDRQRLAGTPMDCTGKTILASLIEGVSLACEAGGDPSHIFLPPETFRLAKEEIRSSTQYQASPCKESAVQADGEKSQTVSFQGFSIDGDKGPVKVYSDLWCTPKKGFILELERFTLHSAGEMPGTLMEDDNRILRMAAANSYEGRVGGYPEMSCDGPGNNVHLYNLG